MNTASQFLLTMPGVFLNIFNQGVLLVGDSTAGKSQSALGLIDRGHQLIADDVVEFHITSTQTIVGSCPKTLQDLIEIRGVGIINLRTLYGDQAICLDHALDLIIELNPASLLTAENRMHAPTRHFKPFADVDVPWWKLAYTAYSNLVLLIECMTKLFMQQSSTFQQN